MKAKVWRYAEPNRDTFEGWFIAFLDSAGCLAILSDYGDYSYRWCWNREDKDIRAFLAGCNAGYVAEKLGYNVKSEFDGEATRRAIQEHILDARRWGDLDKEEARREWDAIGSMEDELGFHSWYSETKISDAHEFYRTCKPQLQAFMKEVWPRLQARIAAELKSETIPETNPVT